LTIINSTISNNSAAIGGGLDAENGSSVTIVNCTIADNTAIEGGGVQNFETVTLSSTIVAGNPGGDWGGRGAVPSSSNNLIGNGGDSGLTNGTNRNIVGTSQKPIDPMLGPLANNGGPTQTRALLPGSPAINAAGTTLPINPLTHLQLT